MKKSYAIGQIVIRIVVILLLLVGTFFLFHYKLYYSSIVISLLALAIVVELVYYIYQYLNQVNKVLLSLLYDDYTVDLKKSSYNQTLNTAIDLYNKIKVKNAKDIPIQLIYNQILHSLSSAVLIMRLSGEDKEIVFMNDFFCKYFGIPQGVRWTVLEERIPSFCQLLIANGFANYKTSLDIQIDNQERQTFVVQASNSFIQGQQYYIVLMDSIQRLMESKENEAWSTIMKVISHELMNSLTPIHSLTSNMQDIICQDQWNEEDKEDLKISLETVINRSNHLQNFVERYRKLTMLPSPMLVETNLHTVLEEILKNYEIFCKKKGIELSLITDHNISLSIDRAQIEQVLINLLSNSISAIEDSSDKYIKIVLYKDAKRVFIEISDSGLPIDKGIIPKIFLPFYTTRKNGAGIGLALSKSIVEAHNGYLYYQEKEGVNTFVMSLVSEV